MATTIVTKYGSDAPAASDIVRGELAVDTENGRLYTENAAGAVVEIGLKPEANVDVTGTITASGEITANGGIALGDSDKATFGASDDLQIYHNANNSYIQDVGTGKLHITSDGTGVSIDKGTSEVMATFDTDGAVTLYHNALVKLATTSTGIDVTGTATMDGLTVQTTNGLNALLESSNSYQYLQFKNTQETNNYLGFVGDDFSVTAANKKYLQVDGNGDISFYEDTGTTAKLFWDASAESLGVGVASPAATIHADASGGAAIRVSRISASASAYGQLEHDGTNTTLTSTASTIFNAGGAERLRIDSSGNLLVGTTTSGATKLKVVGEASEYAGYFEYQSSGYGLGISNVGGSGSTTAIFFFNTNGAVGSISTSGSATAYNTSSDYRLKENIADADDAGSKVDAIKVRKFDWKVDGEHQDYGMIAQELIEVAPEAVSAPADPDEMMGVDYSKLVPMLVKEIQQLRQRVAQLEE